MSMYFMIGTMIGFLSMYVDKQRAIAHQSRISESHLWLIALFTGGIGSFLGMYVFHHKTRKPKFYIGIPIMIMIEVLIYFKWIW